MLYYIHYLLHHYIWMSCNIKKWESYRLSWIYAITIIIFYTVYKWIYLSSNT